MIKILAINYSQSGQLNEIIDKFVTPLNEIADVDRISFKPENNFPFPWTSATFFDAMPESVLEKPILLKPITYKHEQYDLIILGYQPWYLSPSIPTSALLQDEIFLKKLKNTNVITVIGSRNMWINSQKSILQRLQKANANLIGNIPLSDKTNNLISAVTILHWMLSGKKERYLKIFPKPGVSDADINKMENAGILLKNTITTNNYSSFQEEAIKHLKIQIPTNILFIELRAKKLFCIWANIIKNKVRNRKIWIHIFKIYLIFALFFIAPIVLLFYNIFVLPFVKPSVKRKKHYFCRLKNIKNV